VGTPTGGSEEGDPLSLHINGDNAMKTNMNVGGFKGTNAADGVLPTDLATFGQVASESFAVSASVDMFFYHEEAADTDDVIVVRDWGEYNGTNVTLAYGAYSASNLLNSVNRGGVLTIPAWMPEVTSIQYRVFGSSLSLLTNRIEVTFSRKIVGNTYTATNTTTTAADWTDLNIATTGTFLTNDLSGQAVHVTVREYAGWGATSAVNRVWKVLR